MVQLPLLLQAGPAEHRRRNTMLMALPMLVELITAVWLGQIAALALVLVIWIVTFACYIPAYSRLIQGDQVMMRRLVAWNWVRTLCWTARAGILLWIVAGRLDIY